MSESKDRAALRKLALLGLRASPQEVARTVDAALAQPDPAEKLAEALKVCERVLRIGKYENAANIARAALAAYEGK